MENTNNNSSQAHTAFSPLRCPTSDPYLDQIQFPDTVLTIPDLNQPDPTQPDLIQLDLIQPDPSHTEPTQPAPDQPDSTPPTNTHFNADDHITDITAYHRITAYAHDHITATIAYAYQRIIANAAHAYQRITAYVWNEGDQLRQKRAAAVANEAKSQAKL